MIKKILLIQPPYTIFKSEPKGCQPPLGLAYIAAVLLKEGFDVKIIDAIVEGFDVETELEKGRIRYGLGYDDIAKIIKEYAPDLVGISCLFSSQHNNALEVAKLVKQERQDCKVVMGGAHPSVAYESVLSCDSVDFVIIGEGEYSFRDLIYALNNFKKLNDVDGLAFKKNDLIEMKPKTKFIENLDEIPLPARHILPMKKYFEINRPHGTMSARMPNTSMITSRGCPANCIFCSIHSVWGKRFRPRSAENVLFEMLQLKQTYGVKELQFEDDNLTFDKKRAKQIFKMMHEKKINVSWTTPNGVAAYAIDDELIDLMKSSGCYRVCLAIESGDDHVLHKIIKKPLKLDNVESLIKKFNKARIAVDGFFVVGFPGETKAQMKKTFKFASQMNFDNVNFFIATPYPGTELFDICKERGYLEEFSYEKLKVGYANFSTPNFNKDELEKMIAKESLKYRLKQLRNPFVFYQRVIKRFTTDRRFFFYYLKKMLKRIVKVSWG